MLGLVAHGGIDAVPAGVRTASLLFVGRKAEIARFAAATERVRLAVIYGVGGTGKTALMLRAAEDLASRVGARFLYHACRASESAASMATAVLAQLGAAPNPKKHRGVSDPVQAVASLAVSTPLVLCLDDAPRAEDSALLEAVVHFATRRLPLWVCLASRAALPISSGAVDHLVLKLGPLTAPEAHELWAALEELYGSPTAPFETASQRGVPTPLSLKQAFAGPAAPRGGDPLGLLDLPPLVLEILQQVCVLRRPAPVAMLAAGRDLQAASEAMTHLGLRFLVECAGTDAVTAHEVVREAVAAVTSPPALRAAHARCLAFYRELARAGPHDEALEFETLLHAVGVGDDDAAIDVVGHALRESHPMTRFPTGRLLVPTHRVAREQG